MCLAGRSVTAIALDSGSRDSGFESRRPDIVSNYKNDTIIVENGVGNKPYISYNRGVAQLASAQGWGS